MLSVHTHSPPDVSIGEGFGSIAIGHSFGTSELGANAVPLFVPKSQDKNTNPAANMQASILTGVFIKTSLFTIYIILSKKAHILFKKSFLGISRQAFPTPATPFPSAKGNCQSICENANMCEIPLYS
jgi:hypothetical protein